jgi:hypothetical protein
MRVGFLVEQRGGDVQRFFGATNATRCCNRRSYCRSAWWWLVRARVRACGVFGCARARVLYRRYYTIGYWNQTQPVAVSLAAGANTLTFTRTTEHEIAFKEFFVYKTAPDIPAPPANYTPTPAPAPNACVPPPR